MTSSNDRFSHDVERRVIARDDHWTMTPLRDDEATTPAATTLPFGGFIAALLGPQLTMFRRH